MREVTAAILLKLQVQRLGQGRYLPSQVRHWDGRSPSSRRYQRAHLGFHHGQQLANVRGGLDVRFVGHDVAAQRSGVVSSSL